jgi:hypothetical protein
VEPDRLVDLVDFWFSGTNEKIPGGVEFIYVALETCEIADLQRLLSASHISNSDTTITLSAFPDKSMMEYDPFTTPPQTFSNVPTSVEQVVKLSKAAILDFISKFPFDEVTIPTTLVSNEETQTIPFLEAFGSSLIRTLVRHVPKQSSPRKLLSSSTLSTHLPRPEPETPTKPPKKDVKSTFGSSPVERIVSDISLITSQDVMSPQQRRRLALEELDEEQRTTTFKAFTLTRTDVSAAPPTQAQTTVSPPKWDHPPPPFHRLDYETDKTRLDALKALNIDNDPYYIARLERKQGELHPFLWVRGHVQVPADNQGILPSGFESEYYDVESLALLDTGNDVTIIAQEYLGVQLDSRSRVLFNFE